MSPICPTCGCSLVRLEIATDTAPSYEHDGKRLLFCCQACLGLFSEHPERYLDEIRDWIVCPTCLAEKPKHLAVSIEHEGEAVWFCRCPCCVEEFERRSGELLARLAG